MTVCGKSYVLVGKNVLNKPCFDEKVNVLNYHNFTYISLNFYLIMYIKLSVLGVLQVCVSLLGTWSGKGTEVWTSQSNLLQVIISIQGLYLIC